MRRSVESGASESIPGSTYPATLVRLTRLELSRRQTKVRANIAGSSEPLRAIDGGLEGKCRDRTNAWDRHEATAYFIVPRHPQQFTVQDGKLIHHACPPTKQGVGNQLEPGATFSKFSDPGFKASCADPSDLEAEGAKKPANLILMVP